MCGLCPVAEEVEDVVILVYKCNMITAHNLCAIRSISKPCMIKLQLHGQMHTRGLLNAGYQHSGSTCQPVANPDSARAPAIYNFLHTISLHDTFDQFT